ncbi:levansucrase [Erythromicrobium ramosum]|uniref:Levansucrase n=2 Tax=Erythrobacter ramosus TaxID=35811 RepID=A0ABR6I1I1_9SPHN|nr:glycoside hydrolase family 68 protein [Erythrobacter ramosus]MBB3776702.1 levansucrase [Erythrobacter ramosus]
MTSAWTADHVGRIEPGQGGVIPPVVAPDHSGLDAARLYWDMWPVQDAHGARALIAGRELWMALTAPDRGDPALRHFEAKIHWIERRGGAWHDRGPVLPDLAIPYEREWAGSALLDQGVVTLFFTAAGTAARAGGYQQELWSASAPLGADGWPGEWSFPTPLVTGYGPHYMPADAHEGEAGKIKAFRDPAYFRDPADGGEYLAFTASLAGSGSAFNGAFGLALKGANGWILMPPCLHAEGVNNELERAHLVYHAKHYYAFWSTQTATFAPDLRHAPGGLYGMVADSMADPWRPLNGTGLVLANPVDRPLQTYSWFVDASLTVCSFVDVLPDGSFGGVPAPLLRLALDGDRASVHAAEQVA